LDQVEVTLFQHALHEHGTDHTAPTDQTYTFHNHYTLEKKWASAGDGGPDRLQITQRFDYRIAHGGSTDTGLAFRPDVAGAQALIQHLAHRQFDGIGSLGLAEAVT